MLHTLRISHWLLLLLIPLAVTAQNNKNDYLEKISSAQQWNSLAGKPLSSKYGNVSSVKIVYDLKERKLYFIHSRRYKYHFDFCSNYLHTYQSLEEFNDKEYSAGKDRKYLLANINWYKQQNCYTLEFFADDKIQPDYVVKLYTEVKNAVYFSKQFYLILNSEHIQKNRSKLCGGKIACMEVDSLYRGQRYQCLVKGEAIGRLRFVDYRELAKADLRQGDILVTNGLPLMVPPVAGIITSEFQTPLSHINMLARSRKLPDAALRDVWNNKRWRKLEGQRVKLMVGDDSASVQITTETQVNKNNHREIKLSPDKSEYHLAYVRNLRIKHIDIYGGKAANMGELHRIKSEKLNLPEGAFAIPFLFYFKHIAASGTDKWIDSMLRDTSILNNRQKTAAMLSAIRKKIRKFPVEKVLIDSVKARLKAFPQYAYFRFRSSTNTEDIEGFNGAGLYDSYSGSLTDTAKTIENAIRKTWASLWNQRAFEERTIYGINHHNVAIGILVHRAFGTEKSNGVAITANIYRPGYPSFIINCQHGEEAVVSPEPGIQCEQLILNHKVAGTTVSEISADYITRSSLQNGAPVLTNAQLMELARCLFAIKEHFYYRTRYGRKANGFLTFAMDVEFKIDAATGKLYIKQARPIEIKNEE